MKVYCCQLDITWEDKAKNFARVRSLILAQNPERGSLLVLPEMFGTGFSMSVQDIRESAGGETEQFLQSLARELGLYVIGGVVTTDSQGRGLNQAVVFSKEGSLLARYSKIHPFSLGGETQHYARGAELAMFEWNGMKVCPFICYDLRFPEIFRSGVRRGAQIFAVIANWPSKREQHWVTLLQARAIENLAYVIGVNRAGKDPQHSYPGRSVIIDPHGKILADAADSERVISGDVLPEIVNGWRQDFPALRDMHWIDQER